MDLYIIFTASRMWLSKRDYASWCEIQEEYPDYKASVGPWPEPQVIEYLASDYPDLAFPAADQVQRLVSGDAEAVEVAFSGRP